MGIVRVAHSDRGRLVRVALTDVTLAQRLRVTCAIRTRRWNDDLRPDTGYMPTMRQRHDALWDAIQLERAAVAPSSRRYLIPQDAADAVVR